MKKIIKDSEDNVFYIDTLNGFIPPDYTEVAEEDIPAAELVLGKRNKMESIRARRDAMLIANDKAWLIASKKAESVTAIAADSQLLRDLPEVAQSALDALESVEDIEAYDAFADLELSQAYE